MENTLKRHVFAFEQEKWEKYYNQEYFLAENPSVEEVDNGYILPLQKRKDVNVYNKAYAGGVVDADGKFVNGLCRNYDKPSGNRSCVVGYEVPDNVIKRHETVVYGGVLADHFGHFITDSLSHLWWFIENQNTSLKIVFLTYGQYPIYQQVLDLIGLDEKRIEIITKPTQFDKIIVPQESFYMLSHYRPNAGTIFAHMRSHVEPAKYEKVYLSRTKFKEQDTVNEQYYEDFFRRRGYEIIYPETLPFAAQVAIMAGADEVVTTHGTMVYLTLYCKPNTKVVILNRSKDSAGLYALLNACQIDYYLVDAHFDFLPANMNGHCMYFFGPTLQWIDFLNYTGVAYSQDEVSIDLHLKPFVYEYVYRWGCLYQDHKKIDKTTRNLTIVDLISDVNNRIVNMTVDRKAYPDRDDVVKLKKQNSSLKSQVGYYETLYECALQDYIQNHSLVKDGEGRILQDGAAVEIENVTLKARVIDLEKKISVLERDSIELAKVKSSRSWKVTAPLRAIKKWFL